jgi:uncharacterized protein YPO0396
LWTFAVAGDNALLTGDIGSGKSTLVDAVTTLLVPAHRVSYNKAAGADTRERPLRSYVLGHYQAERVESTGQSRPVALRGAGTYSVLLAVFRNDGCGTDVSLAQVFWPKDGSQAQPDRFYLTADPALAIASDFADFGDDMANLKRFGELLAGAGLAPVEHADQLPARRQEIDRCRSGRWAAGALRRGRPRPGRLIRCSGR